MRCHRGTRGHPNSRRSSEPDAVAGTDKVYYVTGTGDQPGGPLCHQRLQNASCDTSFPRESTERTQRAEIEGRVDPGLTVSCSTSTTAPRCTCNAVAVSPLPKVTRAPQPDLRPPPTGLISLPCGSP